MLDLVLVLVMLWVPLISLYPRAEDKLMLSTNRLSIKYRIFLTSGFILLIFTAEAIFSIGVVRNVMSNSQTYETVSDEANLILKLNIDISELQRDILGYSNANHQSAMTGIRQSLVNLDAGLNDISTSVKDKERLEIISAMEEVYLRYEVHIAALEDARALQDRFNNVSLPELSIKVFSLLELLHSEVEKASELALLERNHLLNESLLKANIHMGSYFTNRKYQDQESTRQQLAYAVEMLEKFSDSQNIDSDTREIIFRLSTAIVDYDTSFLQAVQAIRGYLFLVNVVMEGEAQEFSALSKQLTELTFTVLGDLKAYMETQLNGAQRAILVSTLTAIFLGALFSFFVSNTISKPIRNISDTFDRLSAGDNNVLIPELSRGDEIGRLAMSAEKYRDANARTDYLLEESKTLTKNLRAREAQLEISTKELTKSNSQLDNFAYIASHDLRSPLRAIDNLADWIIEDCEEILPDSSKDHLAKLKLRISRMEALLSDLLKYSKVGKVNQDTELVNVQELIKEVISMVDHPIDFEFDLATEPLQLDTFALPLKQVLLNLISNAIKYNDKEIGMVSVGYTSKGKGFVEFSVKDNGPGIDSEFHKKIFQMFQTLNPRDVYEGSGMGLAFVKKIIEDVGGEIQVFSEFGEGATFSFTWPENIIAV